jgi:acetylglutamate kinase
MTEAALPGNRIVADVLLEALPYLHRYAHKTIVVKMGGSTFGQHDTTLDDLVALQRLGINTIVVHGGGSEITAWMQRLGLEARFVDGLRVTDQAAMQLALMTLAGKVNKELVAQVAQRGGRAVGLSGVDGQILQARRKDARLGFVGEIFQVDLTALTGVAGAGFVPIVAPIAIGEDYQALNVNADTAAAAIATAIRAEKLIFLTDVPGVIHTNGEAISRLSVKEAAELIEAGTISGGMIPKVQACISALEQVERTHIIDGRQEHALIYELFTDSGVGTMLTKN